MFSIAIVFFKKSGIKNSFFTFLLKKTKFPSLDILFHRLLKREQNERCSYDEFFKIVFDKLDYELIEQSRVDGCGIVRTFLKVAFPLAKEAIVPTLFLTFIWEYNDYYYPQFFGFAYDNFNVISLEFANGRMPGALNNNALAMLLPALIIYIIIEKTLFNSISKDVTY